MPTVNPLIGGGVPFTGPRDYSEPPAARNGNKPRAAGRTGAANPASADSNAATARNVALFLALALGTVFALHYAGFRGTVALGVGR